MLNISATATILANIFDDLTPIRCTKRRAQPSCGFGEAEPRDERDDEPRNPRSEAHRHSEPYPHNARPIIALLDMPVPGRVGQHPRGLVQPPARVALCCVGREAHIEPQAYAADDKVVSADVIRLSPSVRVVVRCRRTHRRDQFWILIETAHCAPHLIRISTELQDSKARSFTTSTRCLLPFQRLASPDSSLFVRIQGR